MYKVIRATCGYQTVVVEGFENKCYLRQSDEEDPRFEEINENKVLFFISGQADGLGFAELPERNFVSLYEAEKWVCEARIKSLKERLSAIWGEKDMWVQENDNPYEAMDLLMDYQPLTEDEFKAKVEQYNLTEKWPAFYERYKDKFKPPS